MIFQQIKKYPEPQPVTTYTYHSGHWQKTDAEKAEWAKRCEEALLDALTIFKPGDTVTLKAPRQYTKVIIHSFLTDPENIFGYKEEPCFIMATNPVYLQSGPTRYALFEFDLTTIQRAENGNATI